MTRRTEDPKWDEAVRARDLLLKTNSERTISLRAVVLVKAMQAGRCICEALEELSDAETAEVAYLIDKYGDDDLKARWAHKTWH